MQSFARWSIFLALAALLASSLAPADDQLAAGATDPSEELLRARKVVETLHSSLLRSMRESDEKSYETRRDELDPVLRQSFDFSFMAEKSAGRYWRDLDGEARDALGVAMADLAIATYASRFVGYDGERFVILGAERAPYNTLLVRSHIERSDGQITAIDYRLRAGAAPRIVDVFLNGTVSELALRRAEYTAVIKREGFPSLLRSLEEKYATMPGVKP